MMHRADFFALTGFGSDGHTALRRRGLEVVPVDGRDGYSAFGALAALIAEAFAGSPDGHGMVRTMAAEIARDVLPELAAAGPRIEAGEAIFAGRVAYPAQAPAPFVGDADDLAAALAGEPVRATVVNATTVYRVLSARAARAGVDITGMWSDAIAATNRRGRA